MLDAAADQWPDAPAVNFFEMPDARLTFADLRARSINLAVALQAFGIGQGTPVAVVLPNVPAFPVAWLAIARLGAVMVPINPSYTLDELRFVIDDVDVAHVVAEASFAPTLTAAGLDAARHLFAIDALALLPGAAGDRADAEEIVWPDVHPDDVVGIHYTSGTTGFPKGCALTQRSWAVSATVLANALPRTPRRVLSDAPWFYLDAPMELALALIVGAEQYVARKVSLSRFTRWLVDLEIDYCEVWEALGERAHDPEAEELLRQRDLPLMASTFGLPGAQQADLQNRLNAVVREMFGMTEVGLATLVPFEDDSLVGTGSCGSAAPYRETRIVDPETGSDTPPDVVGELWVRGPGLMVEYVNRPEVNAECFQPGGWFRTGDLARRDVAGNHFIAGRLKDMIRRSHENIAANEVEAALASHQAVAEAGVVGVPDHLRGEEVKA
ncbi:MAG: acyl--CoA ligase, partial [Nocardioides sp.]|nr:acyl--CoA ligase [Nocardioides sp.]